jgi:hypothetical protein
MPPAAVDAAMAAILASGEEFMLSAEALSAALAAAAPHLQDTASAATPTEPAAEAAAPDLLSLLSSVAGPLLAAAQPRTAGEQLLSGLSNFLKPTGTSEAPGAAAPGVSGVPLGLLTEFLKTPGALPVILQFLKQKPSA